ncbi:hypothetical protein GGR73_002559 [Xanthomonas sp. F14]
MSKEPIAPGQADYAAGDRGHDTQLTLRKARAVLRAALQ